MQPDQPVTPAPPSSRPTAALPLNSKEGRRLNRGLIGGVIVILILVLVIGGFVWMVQAGVTDTVRDVFIILMALVSLFIGLMLLALVYQVAALTRMLREEIKPLMENAQETVNAARGATLFVSDHVVRPVIGVAGTVAGIARIISLLGDLRRPRR
ncbi:MAG TPA: hypothetical protein VJG32_22095 [Anaerolineae bacterium]|nr:hypothetical protein [Anaerolineae bacterium]